MSLGRALGRLLLVGGLALAGCGGGRYAEVAQPRDNDRGETNGRSLDVIASKPDDTEWTIRFRGGSMWVAYSTREASDDLGAFPMTSAELDRLWALVDEVNLPARRRGRADEDNGSLLLRLREPTDDAHELYTVYVSRETDDDDVIALANYVVDLIAKYRGEAPNL